MYKMYIVDFITRRSRKFFLLLLTLGLLTVIFVVMNREDGSSFTSSLYSNEKHIAIITTTPKADFTQIKTEVKTVTLKKRENVPSFSTFMFSNENYVEVSNATTASVSAQTKEIIKPVTKKPKNNGLQYKLHSFSEEDTRQMIEEGSLKCITEPTKVFCIVQEDKVKVLESTKQKTPNNAAPAVSKIRSSTSTSLELETTLNTGEYAKKRRHPIHAAISDFSRLMISHNIRPVIIEPSILFCMLRSQHKSLLLHRNFNISNLLGVENVVTFAVSGYNSSALEDVSLISKLKEEGFSHWAVRSEVANSWYESIQPSQKTFTTHHFYLRRHIIVHVVVFYERETYFWHGNLPYVPNEILQIISVDDLLFREHDSAFEWFSPVQVDHRQNSPIGIFIPSNPQHFLFQIEASRFLECNYTQAKAYLQSIKTSVSPYYSLSSFERTFYVSLQELKYQLHPLLMHFIIFGGTLLGWYRQCGIIPYTTDVDFAGLASELDDENVIIEKFKSNPHVKLKTLMGLREEAFELSFNCHGIKVDLFFLYEDNNTFWASGHRPSRGYYFRYTYPTFKVCSAELLSHKVQVPCEPESVIRAEYGSGWNKPVSSWSYESSPKNMGPRIYFPENLRSKTYRTF